MIKNIVILCGILASTLCLATSEKIQPAPSVSLPSLQKGKILTSKPSKLQPKPAGVKENVNHDPKTPVTQSFTE